MAKLQSVFAVGIVLTLIALMGGVGIVAAIPSAAGHVAAAPGQTLRMLSHTSSSNWAGYAASTTTHGTVSKVSGSWVEPAVSCTSTTALAAFWVGIDGFNSGTVEQTGTLAQCYLGAASYYAWWEMYPLNAVQPISTMTISAGDHFTATVTHKTGGTFTMYIKDITTGASFSKTATQSGTNRTSAECIAEAPSGSGGLFHLAKFGTVTFSSCTATISGKSGGIGTFGTVWAITMTSSVAGKDKATVSSLTSNKTFHVTWKRAT